VPPERPARVLVTSPERVADLLYWLTARPRLARQIVQLMAAVDRDPFGGPGQPERLRHRPGENAWSRRLDEANRLVYRVEADRIVSERARGHYRD
jgi:toxin YoeB